MEDKITYNDITRWRAGNPNWDIGEMHVNIVLYNIDNDGGYTIVHLGKLGTDRIAKNIVNLVNPDWSPEIHLKGTNFSGVDYLMEIFNVGKGSIMADPDFSLDEISLGEDIITQMG